MAQYTTQFSKGDEVLVAGLRGRYTVSLITITDKEEYGLTDKSGNYLFRAEDQLTLAPAKLSHVEALIEAGRVIQKGVSDFFYMGTERERKAIRHECYKVLGGAGVLDDYQGKAHATIHEWLNAAIDRAEQGQ